MRPVARLAAFATVAPGSIAAGTDGLWRLNAGSTMTTQVDDVNGGKPFRLVVDLSSLHVPPTFQALREHGSTVGFWCDASVDPLVGVTARLRLIRPTGDPVKDDASSVREAADLLVQVEQGVPLQASIGVYPNPDAGGAYELVTAPRTVNGRTVEPTTDLPTYVLTNGLMEEASICQFGADRHTGKVAASARGTPPMSDSKPNLKSRRDALVAKLGAQHRARIAELMADEMDDAAIVEQVTRDAMADMEAKCADLSAKLAAAEAKCAELTAKLEALAPAGGEPAGGTADAKGGAALTATSRLAALKSGVTDATGRKLTGLAALRHLRATAPKLPVA